VKESKYHIIILATTCFLVSACSNTRHLPAGDKLYTGARTIVNGTSTVREKKVLKEDLEGLTRPKPNAKFLGLHIKLSIYNLFRNKKRILFLEGSELKMANLQYYSARSICRETLKYYKATWKTKVISRQR